VPVNNAFKPDKFYATINLLLSFPRIPASPQQALNLVNPGSIL